MASIRRLEMNELNAYAKQQAAHADVVVARIGGHVPVAEVERLSRRATAYEIEWQAAARKLEEAMAR